MTYTAGVYFLGQYRPAYFQGATAQEAVAKAKSAVADTPDGQWIKDRLDECLATITRHTFYSSTSCEHGARGVCLMDRPHDPGLDKVTADMPHNPQVDYSAICNRG